MGKDAQKVFIALLVLVLVAAGYWYVVHRDVDSATGADTTPATATPADVAPAEPRYPLPDLPQEQDGERKLVPLPPLDDSDGYFKLALEDLFGDGVGEILVDKALIEKVVATIDNLPRSQVAERIRPAAAPPGDFEVVDGDDEETFVLGPDNYARYDAIASRLERADPDRVVETYRRFYPLLQEAYVSLGYPGKYFNDRVVEVIDHLLDAPQPEGPILLVRPHVLFEFADSDLQALSTGQKLMIRIGPDNDEKVRKFLESVRVRIIGPGR